LRQLIDFINSLWWGCFHRDAGWPKFTRQYCPCGAAREYHVGGKRGPWRKRRLFYQRVSDFIALVSSFALIGLLGWLVGKQERKMRSRQNLRVTAKPSSSIALFCCGQPMQVSHGAPLIVGERREFFFACPDCQREVCLALDVEARIEESCAK
jgi:hypothetical protein